MTQHATPQPVAPSTDGADPSTPGTTTRRRVLATSGVVAAAAAVTAACGSSSSSGSAPTAAESSAAAAVSTSASSVPVGGGVILKDRQVVITQPSSGTFKAFTAVCTHQGCVVSSVADGKINCACHGSVFSAADGSVEQGPASAPLAAVNVTVSGDQITLA